MGHVSPRPLPAAGEGDELSRRQHRGAGALAAVVADRTTLARFGEAAAAVFLIRRGVEVTDRNIRVGRGEIDLLARHGATRVAVEVKTRHGRSEPLESFTPDKARQVRRLAASLGIARVDLVAVSVSGSGVQVRWLPRV